VSGDPGELDGLIRLVQNHVPDQPWGRWGNAPVPVEISYNDEVPEPWRVKFVAGLRGRAERRTRAWGYAAGTTLTAALTEARRVQNRGRQS
jgi:hypothetical protein